jgi:hypothetical protein
MPGAMPIFLFLQILIGQKRSIATSILFSIKRSVYSDRPSSSSLSAICYIFRKTPHDPSI